MRPARHGQTTVHHRRLGFEKLETRTVLSNGSPALVLDGSDDLATAASSILPETSNLQSFTTEAWIYPREAGRFIVTDDAYDVILFRQPGAGNGGVGIKFTLWGTGGLRQSKVEFRDVRLNEWNHVAVMFDAASLEATVAINGVLSSSPLEFEGTAFYTDPNQQFVVGGFSPTPDGRFNGYVDEVRVSDFVRYSSSFTPVPSLSLDANTRALWHFDEPVGSTDFADSSTNTNALTGSSGAQTGIPPGGAKPPTISTIGNVKIDEDGTTGAVPFVIGDEDSPGASLTVVATSSNQTVVADNQIVISGVGGNRTVTIEPEPHQFGDVTITLTVSDGRLTAAESFVVTVQPVNDAPTISNLADLAIDEDSSTGQLDFVIGDLETAAGELTVTATSSDLTLVPASNITIGGSGPNRTLTVVPAQDRTGIATITVSASDGELTANETFLLTVQPINDAPIISDISDVSIDEDGTSGVIVFTVGDLDTSTEELKVTATSANPALVTDDDITLEGHGAERTIIVVPRPDRNGPAAITVAVSDGELTTTDSFVLTVNPVNDSPMISDIADQVVAQGASLPTLAFNVSDLETPAELLTVVATSGDESILPSDSLILNGNGMDRTLSVAQLPNKIGNVVTVTVEVSDGSASALDTFSITVVDSSPPTVTKTERNSDDGRFDRLTSLSYTFSEDISASLNADDLTIKDSAGGAPVSMSATTVSWEASTLTAHWNLSKLNLPVGSYMVTLEATQISDPQGNLLDGNGDGAGGDDFGEIQIVTFAGDVQLNHDVAFSDFLILSSNFGRDNKVWSDGDFTGDGFVQFDDFLILSSNFGKSLQPLPVPASSAGSHAVSLPSGVLASAVDAVLERFEAVHMPGKGRDI